jgi:hypothetical protein
MDDRLSNLERKVGELSSLVEGLERRLAAMEVHRPAPSAERAPAAPEAPEAAVGAAPPLADVTLVTVLSLVGRTCLVLAGAYLLRMLTDAGTLPRVGGTLLGIGYAVFWLVLAYRLDDARQRLVAPFYGVASSLIAFPILWEARVRVNLMSSEVAALAMAAVTALGLVVAWRRRIESLAWIVAMAGVIATLVFLAAVGPETPFGFYLAFLGVFTLWIGYSLDWIWLRWPVALVADCAVLVMAGSVTGVWQRDGAGSVLLLQLVIFAAYLVSIAARTLWRSRDVIPFEVVQTMALLVVGFGGAVYVTRSTGAGATGLGLASLVFGFGSYGVAFAFVNWREGHWKNFVFYNSLAVVFMLAGVGLTVGAHAQAMIWAGLAVAAAALGYRYATLALGSHSAIYLVAGAIASGLFDCMLDAFTASTARPWTVMDLSAWCVLGGAAACSAIPMTVSRHVWGRYSRLPKIVVVLILLVGAGAAVIDLAMPLMSGLPGAEPDAAVVAAIRTVVLGAAVLLLAWVGGRGVFAEGRWLMYAVLVLGGIKLLVEDLVAGRPATLVFSLAVYGAALIVAPRWVRRGIVTPRRRGPGPAAP